MKPVQVTRFQAEDGTLFDTTIEAEFYERGVRFRQAFESVGVCLSEVVDPIALSNRLAEAGFTILPPR